MKRKNYKICPENSQEFQIDLDPDSSLAEVRKELVNSISFNFLFLDEEEQEILKEEEAKIKLSDVTKKRLYLKKEIIQRKILGEFVETKNGLDYYLYPQEELSEKEMNRITTMMVMGETGVGKSTWLQSFINFLQGIQIEEKCRYYLFDEKKLQEQYNKEHPNEKKGTGDSVTDTPAIYNVKPNKVFNNPLMIIDTPGLGDSRGEEYDKKIIKDINDLFTNKIENLNALCLVFKASDTRNHDRAIKVLNKLFSLFGEEIKRNIIIVFTFVDDFTDISAFKTLTDKKSPFFTIFGDIKNLSHFEFNNRAYSTSDVESFSKIFDYNTKNFDALLKHIFELPPISLESTKKVINDRYDITNKVICVFHELQEVITKLTTSFKKGDEIIKDKHRLETLKESDCKLIPHTIEKKIPYTEYYNSELPSGWYVLYCKSCSKVCHYDCKGPNEGYHSSEYGCKTIRTIGGGCKNCECHYSQHSFHSYIRKSRTAYKYVTEVQMIPDKQSKANEEEKARQREILNKEIREKENILNELNNEIHNSLNESLEKLSLIATKEKDLNKIALKKYKETNGYSKEILKETITDEKIQEVFKDTLDDIESICSNNEQRESAIKDLQNKLRNS